MAVKLEDKTNVVAPDAAFPFGDLKDNSGSNDGVPVNRAVLSDYLQFFAKMLDASGVVANGLLDNETNDFQYFEALIANIRATAASTTEKGTVERATQTEVTTGTDNTRYVAPNTLKTELDLKADKNQGAWTTVTLLNSWAGSLEVRLTQWGEVLFRGILNGSAATSQVIGTLAAPFRPSGNPLRSPVTEFVTGGPNANVKNVLIDNTTGSITGDLLIIGGSLTFVYLQSVRYDIS